MMLKKMGTPDSIVFLRQSVPQPYPVFFYLRLRYALYSMHKFVL